MRGHKISISTVFLWSAPSPPQALSEQWFPPWVPRMCALSQTYGTAQWKKLGDYIQAVLRHIEKVASSLCFHGNMPQEGWFAIFFAAPSHCESGCSPHSQVNLSVQTPHPKGPCLSVYIQYVNCQKKAKFIHKCLRHTNIQRNQNTGPWIMGMQVRL